MTNYSQQENLIHRREAIRRVSALLGGAALIGGTALWTGCRPDAKDAPASDSTAAGVRFTAEEIALLDEVADTILPTTSTPGAKAAQTGAFMALMVTDTYDPKDQEIFRKGMTQLDEACRAAHNTTFMAASPEQRLSLLEGLDKEQKAWQDAKQDKVKAKEAGASDIPNHYFRMMKELSLLGYFTSEVGMNQAMRYMETPGRFDPCLPYAPGEKAWADHA